MQQPTEEGGWIATVLLAIAAIIACAPAPYPNNNLTLMEWLLSQPIHRGGIVFIFMTLLAICGILALRYKWRD